MLAFKTNFKDGADVAKKLSKALNDILKDTKKLWSIPWAGFMKCVLKRCVVDKQRGLIVATFNNLGKDLSRFASDTSRLPKRNAPINKNEEGKGRRDRVFAQGNRLIMEISVDDPARVMHDYMSGRDNWLGEHILGVFSKANLRGAKR